MNLEQQVCSLELARQLKQWGVKQESLFWWGNRGDWHGGIFRRTYDQVQFGKYGKGFEPEYSAFTVAELGEMLPPDLTVASKLYYLIIEKHGAWHVKYVTYHNGIGTILGGHPVLTDGSEADARAKMLIYLLENEFVAL
jgi:hypothetical protein